MENFSEAEMEKVARATDEFDVVFLFTTKWEPPRPLLQSLAFGKALQQRFFDYHEDVTPERAAAMLGGRILRYENRNNEWIAIIAIERIENARFRSVLKGHSLLSLSSRAALGPVRIRARLPVAATEIAFPTRPLSPILSVPQTCALTTPHRTLRL